VLVSGLGGAVCKFAGEILRRFESCTCHQVFKAPLTSGNAGQAASPSSVGDGTSCARKSRGSGVRGLGLWWSRWHDASPGSLSVAGRLVRRSRWVISSRLVSPVASSRRAAGCGLECSYRGSGWHQLGPMAGGAAPSAGQGLHHEVLVCWCAGVVCRWTGSDAARVRTSRRSASCCASREWWSVLTRA